jgi:hypothetical protein
MSSLEGKQLFSEAQLSELESLSCLLDVSEPYVVKSGTVGDSGECCAS